MRRLWNKLFGRIDHSAKKNNKTHLLVTVVDMKDGRTFHFPEEFSSSPEAEAQGVDYKFNFYVKTPIITMGCGLTIETDSIAGIRFNVKKIERDYNKGLEREIIVKTEKIMNTTTSPIHFNIKVCQESIESTKRTIENLLTKYPVDIGSDFIELDIIEKDSLSCLLVAKVGRKLIEDIELKYNIELVDITSIGSIDVEFMGVIKDE